MSSKVLDVKDLCKTYVIDEYSNNVLQNVSFSMEEGEFVSIMGPSGSGKSTLLYTVSGMDNMTSGKVTFDGEDISSLDRKAMAKVRLNKMGFVFQQMYMMKKLNIMDNIILPGYQAKLKPRTEVNKDAETLMRRLGIIDTADRFITEVSGGQLQRACLCRSLINSPKMITTITVTNACGMFSRRVPRFCEFITEDWAEILTKSGPEDLIALFIAVYRSLLSGATTPAIGR